MSLVHGGPSQAMRVMELALTAQGVTVETATTDDDGPGRRMVKRLEQRIEDEGALRWYFPKNTEFYKCSWPFGRWIYHHVRDYDLVHIHALFSFASNVAAWAARWAGIPYVVRPLGTLNQYGIHNRRPGLKQLSLRWLEGPIIQHAAAVHFTSTAEQREVESLGYAIRSAVIPLALPSLDLPESPPLAVLLPEVTNKRVVLYLSRLDPKKNVEGLLGGFASEAVQRPELHLVVAGSGELQYVAELKSLASQLGIGARVSWPGHVQGEMKAALLRDAAVFVLPSYSENFGIAVAEALAAGLPCVVGRGVALAEQVEGAGAGVSVGADAVGIANGLRGVLKSELRRAMMAAKALAFAEANFSSAVMGQRLRALYDSILEQQPPK